MGDPVQDKILARRAAFIAAAMTAAGLSAAGVQACGAAQPCLSVVPVEPRPDADQAEDAPAPSIATDDPDAGVQAPDGGQAPVMCLEVHPTICLSDDPITPDPCLRGASPSS